MLRSTLRMCSSKLNEYISKPKCIGEFSSDKYGNILKNKTQNKCYLHEGVTKQDILCLNLNSSQIKFEDITKKARLELRKNILKNLIVPGCTLKESLSGAEFYCSIGILQKFAASHFLLKSINVACIKIDNVIVMVDSRLPEKSQKILLDEFQFSISNSSCPIEYDKVDGFLGENRYQNVEKYIHFLKKSSITGERVFKEGVKVWKQYRRAYVTEIMDQDNEEKPLRIAYNSVIHLVDEETDKPVAIRRERWYAGNDKYIWNPPTISKIYFDSVLLDINKIAIGEIDENDIVHRTKIRKQSEILEEYSVDRRTLHKNLCFVLNKIKSAFEVGENDCVKYVNVKKLGVNDNYHVRCYGEIPEDEFRVRVFDDL